MQEDVKKLLAVAIHYNKLDTPTVPAKGQGYLAQKMLDVANEHNIPIIENKQLAELLSSCEINDEIPVEAYFAIAQILKAIGDL